MSENTARKLTEQETSRYLNLPTCRVHYNEAGEGEVLIFCIGNGPGTSAWVVYHRIIDALSAHFHCILLDQPGYGKSDALVVKGESRSTMYARTIRELMDALAIDKATIVDMSFGGQTGQVFALENPDRVARLVQLAAMVRLPAIFYNEPTDARLALQAAFANPSIETIRTMMHRFLYRGEHYSDEELMLEQRLQSWLARSDQREALAASENRQRNVNEDLHRITAPVLMIFGRDDRIIGSPEGALVLFNYLKDVRLIILKNCGHWIPFERPAEFSRYVIDFVKNTPSA